MIGMDGPTLEEERALELILHNEARGHRKIRPAKVTGVNGGFIDVELIDVDNFRDKDGNPERQEVTLKRLPLMALGSGDLVVGLTPAVGAEVLVVCSDRSVKRHKDAAAAETADVTDLQLHGFNGAMVMPFEISEVRLFEGGDPGTLIVGTKDSSSRIEIKAAGTIEAKADMIKLGGDAHPVANADQTDSNISTVATKVDVLGGILGAPPLPPLPSTALTKVKGV